MMKSIFPNIFLRINLKSQQIKKNFKSNLHTCISQLLKSKIILTKPQDHLVFGFNIHMHIK
jgi:hypothetical protein